MAENTAAAQEAPGVGDGTDAVSARTYDFRQPSHISKDRYRAIEANYGMLCKSFESWLSTRVRAGVELQLTSVEQLSFGDYTNSLPNPTASFVFNVVGNSGDRVVIDFGQDFAFFVVDRLLGSNCDPIRLDRSLTVLERMIVRFGVDQVATQLVSAWKDRVKFTLALERFESAPELLRSANREDPMLVARIQVIAQKLKGELSICMPLAVIEDFLTTTGTKHQIGRGSPDDRAMDRSAIEKALREASVDVSVRTPLFGMLLSDLDRIRPGHVIRTGLPPTVQLTVSVEGTPRFMAQPGRAERALAVRIIETHSRVADERAENNGRQKIMATMVDPGSSGKEGLDLAELESNGKSGAAPLSNIYQISLPVTIELGRTRMNVQDVLELGRGSVVVLDRLVGEPVDVIVGDRQFAEGEVVVIGEQFGVRITRIVSQPQSDSEQS